MVERYTPLEKYFDSLQKELENSNDIEENDKSYSKMKSTMKSKVSGLFNKRK